MKKFFYCLTILAASIAISKNTCAQHKEIYSLDKKISLPGNGGYDYLFIDKASNRLYISHGTSINVIDLTTEQLIGTISDLQGDHGIAIASSTGQGFISDGKANAVVVFDPVSLKKIKVIPLSGQKPDAIIYDPFSNRVFAFNGGSNNTSVIDVNSLTEIKTIPLNGAPEFAVADGHGKIYNNLEDKNILKVINSKSLTTTAAYPLTPCGGPTGITLDSVNQRLFTVCRENKGMSVIDINTGKIVATIPIGAGVDAVAYDAVTKLIFCSNGDGTTTIIKQETADKYSAVQTLATQTRAKTLALDTNTHKIYLSVVDFEKGTKNVVPESFKVLVYKMN